MPSEVLGFRERLRLLPAFSKQRRPMRKLMWGGIALIVCSAVGVYLVALYAAENRSSLVARSATGVLNAVAFGSVRPAVPETTFETLPPITPPAAQEEDPVEPIVIEHNGPPAHELIRRFPNDELPEPPPQADPVLPAPERMPYADEEST